MTEETQAVVTNEADTQQNVAAEAGVSAQNETHDLDSLLKEWETEGQSSSQVVQSNDVDTKTKLDTMYNYIAEQQRSQDQAEVQKLVETVKGELPIPADYVKAILEHKAASDPRISQAWMDREKSPEKWEKIVNAVKSEIHGNFKSLPDASVSKAREKVAAVIQGAQTTETTTKSYGQMSDAEFFVERQRQIRGN